MIQGARTPLTVDLGGYRVAISAGANGIGRVIADSFSACGASVFVSDIDERALAECGHPGMHADAGVAAECEAFVDTAVRHLGGLDVLVNNAGIAGPTALVEHVTPEELDATLRIDLAAMFHCSRRAIPTLRANGGGAIVNLSSAAGRFGFALRAPYSAAKWGVIGFTKSLSIEVGPDGIRVNAILPGGVDTLMYHTVNDTAEAQAFVTNLHALKRVGRPEEIARAALFLASDDSSFITGTASLVDGGLSITRT